jgi:hypothetical protein
MALYTVQLPESLYRKLQRQAAAEHRSVDELVSRTLSRQIPPAVPVEDDLPPLLREELGAMEHLSDTALWLLARSRLTDEQLAELDHFSWLAKERALTIGEQARQDALLQEYNETVLRRAHAAMLLSSRGYDMSDPAVLRS